MRNYTKIIFLVGPPASGKDTQGKLLAKKFDGEFTATSDLLREFFKRAKKRYLRIGSKTLNLDKEKEKLISGDLIDSSLVTHIVLEKIKKVLRDKKTLVIAGSPRKFFEAKEELKFLNKFLKDNFVFIFLDVSQKEILRRCLKRGREDDKPEIIKKRIENYKKDTLPAINFLKEKKVLIRVNGNGNVLKIHRDILKKLSQFIYSKRN